MGFPIVRCQKALLATGNSDPEIAMNWLFAHMEDPGLFPVVYHINPPSTDLRSSDPIDIDAPIDFGAASGGSGGGGGPEPSADQVAMLADMGFTSAQARKALRETVRFNVLSQIKGRKAADTRLDRMVGWGPRTRRRMALLPSR